MKRAVAILLIVVAAVWASACGGDTPAVPTAPTSKASAAPVLTYFYSDKPSVSVMQPCTALRWDVTGDATIRVRIEPTVGDGLPVNGFRTVCPAIGTTYTLTATDAKGRKASGMISIFLSTY